MVDRFALVLNQATRHCFIRSDIRQRKFIAVDKHPYSKKYFFLVTPCVSSSRIHNYTYIYSIKQDKTKYEEGYWSIINCTDRRPMPHR